MGVPKFYRWISERYPCLSEVVRENQIPEFDNLYLDMNGVIHVCSHPNDDDPHFRISEEKIFKDIFHYIEVLFRIIKPRKVFFMAVDGVAPRAKMNQQRGRRFRSARAAEEQEKKALSKGETLPTEKRFDSNCITPGTEFMVKLNEQLKYFVNKKITEDEMWRGLRIYLSGHETPGEGEHKVMEFIRAEKADPKYDPNTRHCLYGLDADLMMLGLTSHEPHFSLLREEVRFGKKSQQKRTPTPEETTFHLLHLSLFREYLEFEFQDVKGKISFDYDLERIIDDWVLMGFLVGNDFIPHLPDLHINHDALPLLYKTYIEVLPLVDGYLNEDGILNLKRFEVYLKKLSEFDRNKFSETSVDLKYFEGKKGSTEGSAWKGQRIKKREEKKEALRAAKNLAQASMFQVLSTTEESEDSSDNGNKNSVETLFDEETKLDADVDEAEIFEMEFRQHKRNYYQTKLGYENVTEEVLKDQALCYVTGIQWILHYYYNGVQSWGWYYPHHYAPFMSDVCGFSDCELKYDIGRPFKPFEQLLAVLPAASGELLPKPFQSLMIMDNSPIIEYYPVDFDTDLNGKQQDWEAVVLIPFIDEKCLLDAMAPLNNILTDEEKRRNSHGPHLLYTYDKELSFCYPSSLPGVFTDINCSHAKCEEVPLDAFRIDISKMRKGLLVGTKQGVFYPGFPTMRHVPHKAQLKKEGVKVFQMNSRGDNMMLYIMNDSEPEIEKVANELLGKTIFAGWPHLQEVRVVSVTDDQFRYELKESKSKNPAHNGTSEIICYEQSDREAARWVKEVQSITEHYRGRKGVEIGQTFVIVYATPMAGRRYVCGAGGLITLEKQWESTPTTFALQTTVKDIAAYDPSFKQFSNLEDLFPPESECFMLGTPHYGCMGEVIEVDRKGEPRIRVVFSTPSEPRLDHIMKQQWKYEVKYVPGYILAQRLGISSHLVSRITGSFLVLKGSSRSGNPNPSKVNIGLNLKFNKRNKEVAGFTRKDEDGNWTYSIKTQHIIADYIEKFPDLFDHVSQNAQNDMFYEDDVFGEDSDRASQISDWLKTLSCHGVEQTEVGLKSLDENVVKAIQEEMEKNKQNKTKRKLKMSVKPYLLFRPVDQQGHLIPDPDADYELFDRVINVRDGFTVPLGLRGVVTGIISAVRPADILYEVIFDDEFLDALVIRGSGARGYHMPPSSLINISYGMRKEHSQECGMQKPMAVVKPQTAPEKMQSMGWYSDMVKSAGSSSPDNRRGFYSPRINHSPNSPFVPSQIYRRSGQGSGNVSFGQVNTDRRGQQSAPQHSQNRQYNNPPNSSKKILKRQAPQQTSQWNSPQGQNLSPRQQDLPPRLQKQNQQRSQHLQQQDIPPRFQRQQQTPCDKNTEKDEITKPAAEDDVNEFANIWKSLQDPISTPSQESMPLPIATETSAPSSEKLPIQASSSPISTSLAQAAAALPIKSAQEERERLQKNQELVAGQQKEIVLQHRTPHKKIQLKTRSVHALRREEEMKEQSVDELAPILTSLHLETDAGPPSSTVTITNSQFEQEKAEVVEDIRKSPGTIAKESTEAICKLLNIGSAPLQEEEKPVSPYGQPVEISTLFQEAQNSMQTPSSVTKTTQPVIVSSQPTAIYTMHHAAGVSSTTTSVTTQPGFLTSEPQLVSSQPGTLVSQPTFVQMSSHAMSVSSQPRQVTSQPVALTSQPMILTNQPMPNPLMQARSVSSRPMVLPSQPMSMPQPRPVTMQTAVSSMQPMSLSAHPVPMSISQPMHVPSQPVSMISQPMPMSQTRHMPSQPVTLSSQLVSPHSLPQPIPLSSQSVSSQHIQGAMVQPQSPGIHATTVIPQPQQNSVMELFHWCKKQKYPPPTYTFHNTPQGLWVCTVRLVSGVTYNGIPCNSKDHSCASAASVALTNVVMNQPQRYSQSPRGQHSQYIQSPRQPQPQQHAVSPHMVPVRSPHGVAIRGGPYMQYQQPTSRMQMSARMQGSPYLPQQQPSPQYYHHNQPRPGSYSHQYQQISLHQPVMSMDYGQQPPLGTVPQSYINSNPFIPPQVARMQVTPVKSKSMDETRDAVDDTNQSSNTLSQVAMETVQKIEDPELIDQSTTQKSNPTPRKGRKGGKRQANLAINFSGLS
ncbi:5'-3' exoribonuclease 1-like [Saccoglossus kowalevskii]|uniref:5'-3' exoribonuclease 1-like n=1 Tax=Saccoglossus kowalevskii TaxID=10224 RepID=A0ABM0GI77_SACKO|nr:PREDICTED: 5'-3' exoribonuclease 1-like [Saccoglossus kowalevskii]